MYSPPVSIQKIFSSYAWKTGNNKILLTFDDGPLSGNTDLILARLEKHKIKALFFVVGGNCERNPSLINEILSQGHTIGNHTFHHLKPSDLSAEELRLEIDMLNNLILTNNNYQIKYFRPPHGRFSLNLAGELKKRGMKNVMWSLLTFDYKNDYKLVKFTVQNYLSKDSIVVLHDSIKSKDIITDSIDLVCERCGEIGGRFGEAEECLN
jgi:peptidoglycan/xylan/chitin deacetylase (PgdA/CDA1 family)